MSQQTDINTKLYLTRQADLIVSAVGKFSLTREACPNAIVIDVGIRRNEAGITLGDFVEIDEIAKEIMYGQLLSPEEQVY